jgi:hypothetical protein
VSKPRFATAGAIQTPSTASTVQIYSTIRKALLDYVSTDNQRLAQFVNDRIYVRSMPTPVQFPYITMLLNRTSLTAYNGYRETVLLEVQAIGKPESQLPLIESAMDIVDQCLTAYTDARSGIMVGRSRNRQTVPMFSDPADASVVGIIATYEFYLWPRVLTARAN